MQADDKSILARFYYADRALTAVASELDSFDGRAEPERCSRLVARLRQGQVGPPYIYFVICISQFSPLMYVSIPIQDQVLSITNIIMDELLGDDRAPRAFRAKFPEEVLQESLAGQLWFGAECLAAGSSIMNREAESATMRPLAKAVTKSLDHVRNLLREQCLRNKTPNSLTLNLDLNDAITETLCESLKIFDRLFAEFELLYVSAMVQVKSKQEHETQELITVLFSETLQRALRLGLLQQDQVDYYDPALMFSIPRLAIVAGLVIYNEGPLNMSRSADHLSEMFRPFRTLLIKIRDLLHALNADELHQLEQLLCTNEDLHIIKQQQLEQQRRLQQQEQQSIPIPPPPQPETSPNCDDNDDDVDKFNASSSAGSSTASTASTSEPDLARNVINSDYNSRNSDNLNVGTPNYYEFSPRHGEVIPPHVWTNDLADTEVADRLQVCSTQPTTPDDTANADDDDNAGESASGYLIPNTNFGNLLQTTDAPLTDSFIASDDEYATQLDRTMTNDEPEDADGEEDGSAFAVDDGAQRAGGRSEHLTAAAAMRREGRSSGGRKAQSANEVDSGVGTAENTSIDHTPDSESSNPIVEPSASLNDAYAPVYSTAPAGDVVRAYSGPTESQETKHRTSSSSSQSNHHHHHSHSISRHQRCEKRGCTRRHHQHYAAQSGGNHSINGGGGSSTANYVASLSSRSGMRRRWSRQSTDYHTTEETRLTLSTSSTSSTNSDSETQEVTMALRAASRMKFK